MISVKNIISKCLESLFIKVILWIVPIVISGVGFMLTNTLNKKVTKITNPPISSETNHVKDDMHLLVSRCGQWSGMAWAWIKTDKNNKKSLGFYDVIAFDEVLNEPRSVYYENPAYRQVWDFDEEAYTRLNSVLTSSYLLLEESNSLWSKSPFFFGIRPMIWAKTNVRRVHKGLSPVLLGNVYISVVKKYDNIIYFIALTLPVGKSFCTLDKDNNYYNSIDRTGEEIVKIADKLKTELGL